MRKSTATVVIAFLLVWAISVSSDVSGGAVSVGNRLDYSLSSDTSEEILEDYFDIDYTNDFFRARLRYEVFQPSLETRDSQGLVFRAVGVEKGTQELWVGHFYELFGRGIAFRGYEDRDLRVDSSLDGVNVSLAYGSGSIKAFSGRTSGEANVFHGVDVAVRPFSQFSVGGNYVSRRDVSSTGYVKPDVELGTGRGWVEAGPMDFYCELGHRTSDGHRGSGIGAYAAGSGFFYGIGFGLEYKNYWNMSLTAEGKEYSTPPPAAMEHTWALLARHTRELDSDDERGFLGRIDWQGEVLGINAAFSFTEDHGDVDPTEKVDLLDIGNLFNGEALFQEATIEARIGEFSTTPAVLVAGWTEESNGRLSLGTEVLEDQRSYLTFVGDVSFPLRDRWSGRVELGHQHADGDAIGEYDLEHMQFELSKSPGLSIALVCEFANVSDTQEDLPWLHEFAERTTWIYAQTVIDIAQGHQFRVMVGSRPEGKVCAGGACRIEPEFRGVELSVISML